MRLRRRHGQRPIFESSAAKRSPLDPRRKRVYARQRHTECESQIPRNEDLLAKVRLDPGRAPPEPLSEAA